ncbi:hypothetical protein CONLIGDRAFT_638833 [Coniochaeta ligniaria NRRL 30616]|uniref:GCN5-related N-acetyltransferase Rv2170-like domain-containing protein n=1 Tax=Coniochaeta ligniaria NRRL 30616 TaxID=1408157 RepID=A0A1J7J4U1_9PEZI|nr:hypothetical protein CONLIGDRAFT_638833 [Coniochaeta ligniaria NRRL 30616]
MAPIIETFPPSAIPAHLLTRLTSHLPFSIAVLRRLQVASLKKGGSTPTSHILYVHSDGSSHAAADDSSPFAAAYVDLSRGPETECWIYSSLQDSVPLNPVPTSSEALPPADLSRDERDACVQQLLVLLRRIRGLEASYASAHHGEEGLNKGHSRGYVRIGALHETVRRLLVAAGVRVKATGVVPVGQEWEFYATWLIRVEDLRVENEVELPGGMGWDVLREGDTGLVKSRTKIPKRDDTMLMVPSTVIRGEDGTAIAWGYLGVDGSVSTLHVEEPYRGRGLAKALTGRLLRERLRELGDDGWCSTDISTTNLQSQGVFKSIGGKPAWTVSW